MSVSRRDALILGGAAAFGLAGCGRVATEVRRRRKADPWREPSDPKVTRLLDRMTFGWSDEEENLYTSLGHEAYVHQQLEAKFEEPIELQMQLQSIDAINMESVELMDFPREDVIQDLQCAAFLRATYSRNQL